MAVPPVVSVRLWNVLRNNGFKILGNLHGLRLSDFHRFRNCGKRTVLELEAFVRGLQGGITTSDLLQQTALTEPPRDPNVFSVAPSAQVLKPSDLPLSVRAENVLERMGVHRLGDLEGVTTFDLLRVGNCGKKTVLEIQTLLQRARAGEFDFTPEPLQKLTSFDLLAQIDEMRRQLWWSRQRCEYLLNQITPKHRAKAEDMIRGDTVLFGTVFRRVRNGKSMAELRTYGIAGCRGAPGCCELN